MADTVDTTVVVAGAIVGAMPAVDMGAATPVAAFMVEQSAVAAGSTVEQSVVADSTAVAVLTVAEASMAEAASTVVAATADAGNVPRLKLEKAGSFALPAFFFAHLILASLCVWPELSCTVMTSELPFP